MKNEPLFDLDQTGVQIFFHTYTSTSHPVHWHPVIELVYVLNGNGRILLDGAPHVVVPGEFLVIDSDQMHECWYRQDTMLAVIQYSRKALKPLMPDLDRYLFRCAKRTLRAEQLDSYLRICETLKELPPLCLMPPAGYKLKGLSIAMGILYELLHNFSEEREPLQRTDREELMQRLDEISAYVEEHHAEPMSLQDISSHFYLSREYFSRFFRKNMGVSFLRYLNEVRLVHIYHEICSSPIGIMDAAAKHGFSNYKLFNRMFHEVYGCTPAEVRRSRRQNEQEADT